MPKHAPRSTETPQASVVKDRRTSISYVGPRQLIAALAGTLLFGLASHANFTILLPSNTPDIFLPALLIPLFFGVLYGPWVGLVVGGFGFLLGDYVANYWLHDLSGNIGYLFYALTMVNRDVIGWNGFPGYLGSAMIGIIAGLTRLRIRRYNTIESLATVGVICAAATAAGIAIAVYGAVWLYRSPFYTLADATTAFFDIFVPNLLFALLALPVLLWIYDGLILRRKTTNMR